MSVWLLVEFVDYVARPSPEEDKKVSLGTGGNDLQDEDLSMLAPTITAMPQLPHLCR